MINILSVDNFSISFEGSEMCRLKVDGAGSVLFVFGSLSVSMLKGTIIDCLGPERSAAVASRGKWCGCLSGTSHGNHGFPQWCCSNQKKCIESRVQPRHDVQYRVGDHSVTSSS
ncbi:Protein CBG21077 [Caenorhabditis briggsae]|uniref:Protein CBG21077 n=1 Tax=Caenorhabditis briggsae TaxID=6238 RepID=A8XZ91_CAEBR|nr:Protein CBG21077 [Caenorhabditis briggsae]CAP37958.1 Protein CBG21077 [Caenorhabditis briggsae]